MISESLSGWDEDDQKMWDLHRYSTGGWHLVHRMFHPGTSRLDWVLKTSHQVMKTVSGEDNTRKKAPAKSTSKRRAK